MIDEKTLREWMRRVAHGDADRRTFLRALTALGLSGPAIGSLLAAAAPASAQGQTARPEFVPQRRGGGGKLNLLWWQAPTILNAHLASGTKDYDASRVVYEPLAAFDPEANLVPVLAVHIPSVENGDLAPDGTAVTWRLKPGVTWHDGRPFTADDVMFTWEYAADPATSATTASSYQSIDHIDKVDTHTVRVVFKEPTPYWYDAFCGNRGLIMPQHLFAAYKGQNSRNAPYNLAPVGTGPYKIDTFRPGDAVQYDINANYHVPKRPFFDRVELKGGGDATSAARAVLQTGEFDFAWNMQVEHRILERLARGGRGRIEIVPGSLVEHLLINQTDPWTEVDGERSSVKKPHPFQTAARIREAYAKAVDRRTIVEQFYGPGGQATANFLNAPSRYASPNTTWEFDLGKAASLLDQAGWSRGSDGIRVKNGQRMKIVYQTSVNPIRQKTQAIVKKAFEHIGIEVEIKAVNAGVYFSSHAGNPDTYAHFYTDVQMYAVRPGAPDPTHYMEQFTSWQVAQKANHWSGRNITRWSDPGYDQLWRRAASEHDSIKRAALFVQMNDRVVQNHVVVPIVWRNEVSAVSQALGGLRLTTWDSDLWHLAYWYRNV